LILDEDDIPLAQLKKLKHEKQVPDSSMSDIESAAFSLTKLQGDPYFKGPIHKFLTSPLLGSHGRMVDFMSQYGSGFAAISEDSVVPHPNTPFTTFTNNKPFTLYVPTVYGSVGTVPNIPNPHGYTSRF
jgi:hypothetical protein